jgi:hypothetical protein
MMEAEVNALMSSVDEAFWKQAGLITEASEKQPPLAKLHPPDQELLTNLLLVLLFRIVCF